MGSTEASTHTSVYSPHKLITEKYVIQVNYSELNYQFKQIFYCVGILKVNGFAGLRRYASSH